MSRHSNTAAVDYRGSFLYFSGSKAFMQIISREHNMLKRQALILKAGTHPLTDQDRARLKVNAECIAFHLLMMKVSETEPACTSAQCQLHVLLMFVVLHTRS